MLEEILGRKRVTGGACGPAAALNHLVVRGATRGAQFRRPIRGTKSARKALERVQAQVAVRQGKAVSFPQLLLMRHTGRYLLVHVEAEPAPVCEPRVAPFGIDRPFSLSGR